MSDWLIAFDDGLVQRLRWCTVCESAPAHRWAIWEGSTRTVAYVLCVWCDTTDPRRRAVIALLERRYGVEGRSP